MITVFDLDGVLSRSDTMATVVFARLRRRPWLVLPVAVLAVIVVLSPAHGALRPRCNRAIVRIALAGLSEDAYRALAADAARTLAARPGNAPAAVIAAVHEAQAAGVCVVTTATERFLAQSYLECIGVGATSVQASEFSFGEGPRFAVHNVGAAKLVAFRSVYADVGIDRLYTDSASDLPLARHSSATVLVRPSRRSVRLMTRSGVAFQVML